MVVFLDIVALAGNRDRGIDSRLQCSFHAVVVTVEDIAKTLATFAGSRHRGVRSRQYFSFGSCLLALETVHASPIPCCVCSQASTCSRPL